MHMRRRMNIETHILTFSNVFYSKFNFDCGRNHDSAIFVPTDLALTFRVHVKLISCKEFNTTMVLFTG
jgi:hypothetical protein